jgi:RNA polymerase-binding transcription factor
MNGSEQEQIRRRLLALKAEILAAGDIAPAGAREDPAAVGGDEDTQPFLEMSQSIASSRNRNRTGVLARVVAALARLDADPAAFGSCVDCGEPIPRKRLALMPYAELCVECQQAQDGPRAKRGRRHLTDFR